MPRGRRWQDLQASLRKAQAKRPNRSEPRPILEALPLIDIFSLWRRGLLPENWFDIADFRFAIPAVRNAAISRSQIVLSLRNGETQVLPVTWKQHLPRVGVEPVLTCECGRKAKHMYFHRHAFRCRRCTGAVWASQVCSGEAARALVRAAKLRSKLAGHPDESLSTMPKKRHPKGRWDYFNKTANEIRALTSLAKRAKVNRANLLTKRRPSLMWLWHKRPD